VTPENQIRDVLRVACEDALFGVAGASMKALDTIKEHRVEAYESIAREGLANAIVMADFETWLATLTRSTAAEIAPWFVPMRNAIADGMTLHREGRGLRGLIPIGREEARQKTRRDGLFAVRVARAVAAADGVVSPDETRALELLLAALGLPDEDARVLRAEAPIPMGAIEIPSLEPKTARAIVAGAWQVAGCDGFEEAETAAINNLAVRLGVDELTLESIRVDESEAVEKQRRLGRAMVDVVRYVTFVLPPEEASALTLATVHMAVPPIDRAEALRIASTNATTPLVEKHDLDRAAKERVLAVAWIVALAIDPRLSMRAALRARHEHAATHLDASRHAKSARDDVESFLDEILSRAATIVGV
jgi:tellurite resistance protein